MNYFSDLANRCYKTGNERSCRNLSYFHCNRSLKCVPYHRVSDGINDCFFDEDEQSDACLFNDSNRFICKSEPKKCLSPVAVGSGHYQCSLAEDEIYIYISNVFELLPFPDLCNKNIYRDPILSFATEASNANCEWWPCDNPYTRCNKKWDCSNGADELGCSKTNCSLNEHECKNELLGLSYCLPIANMFDKFIDDCSDKSVTRQLYFDNGTHDWGEYYYSWNKSKCVTAEKICRYHLQVSVKQDEVCLYQPGLSRLFYGNTVHLIRNNKFLCTLYDGSFKEITSAVLTTWRSGNIPKLITNTSVRSISKLHQKKMVLPNIDFALIRYCHQGIVVLTGVNERKECLCPPSYFGNRCQWQNQRISLTLQFSVRSKISMMAIFQMIIMLIDEQGHIVGDHEQITYMPVQDCNTKYNIYLLYPTRPKNLSINYAIRIDAFDKTTLDYWASWYLPIPFSFLPVNRIATRLDIFGVEKIDACSLSCGTHGRCVRYTNNKSLFFCQCEQGYSGSHCDIPHICSCANDSICLTSSICVCSLHRFGPRCYLKHSICQSNNNTCQHNGLCIPTDDRISLQRFICFCTEDYSGERCEKANSEITIYLDETITAITSSVLIHFITAFQHTNHEQTTTLKKIPSSQQIITLSVAQPFNMIFFQIPNQYYYLAVLREALIPSEKIYTEILPKQRCSPIEELLNNTFLNYDYFRRVKYYPFLCRNYSQLMCFYDKHHMCICDLDRFSNCFLFNHTIHYDCQGYNDCENDGQCFQNNQTCPTKFLCTCEDCYYGSKCQFSTKGFIFSLDPILGYHIKQNVAFNRQPLIVKISLVITVIIFILGLISGSCSIITFSRKKIKEVGCGFYLLVSSISSICMVVVLTIKFSQLVLSQVLLLTNRSLLIVNCISLDFMLKILLVSTEWFNAGVAVERMTNVIQCAKFNKRKSKQIAKLISVGVFLLVTSTHIHDPIHRKLVEDLDGDEKRLWCLVRYSSIVNIYDLSVTLFHFLVPLSINLISTIVIIIKLARKRFYLQPQLSFQEHIRKEICRHKHLLFAPCILVLLALPRLIISFIKGCMRSPREPWLYLIGYYVSFLPSISTFFIFVLPSKNYKHEFDVGIQRWTRVFHTTS
ncbi:unnamed protein product [Rotaria sp. Silwood2]|nr:unnamed protein product [Rotaria sp. Silwood2]CAF4511246.1 unnamed protein product [Rotaria sp. Silwood2]